jgi:DNA repair photolyase
MKLKVIYEPTGRAGEYAELATDPYIRCGHGCEYCYVFLKSHKTLEQFVKAELRNDYLQKLEVDAKHLKSIGETRPIQLSFMCDPYQPIDKIYRITRKALEILFKNELNIQILTKGGFRSVLDFDLFQMYREHVTYGATLVFADDANALRMEPGAVPTSERIEVLEKAYKLGIRTWVSMEPVYDPKDAYELINRTHTFVDKYKVGKLNYRPEQHNVDWKTFAIEIEKQLQATGREYYLKNDLRDAKLT